LFVGCRLADEIVLNEVIFRGVAGSGGFVELAHGIEHQVGGGAQNGALSRGGAVGKFVNASAALDAALENVDDSFVAEKRAAFGVSDFAGVEEEDGVGFTGVDVQRAGLVRMAE